jgi:hypothetical protein
MPAVLSEPWSPAAGDTDLWVAGVSTALKPGDALLILGAERLAGPSPRWALRVLSTVEPDPAGGRTRAAWTQPLAANDIPADRAEVHVLRQRAARFGAAAPNPGMFLPRPSPTSRTGPFPPAKPSSTSTRNCPPSPPAAGQRWSPAPPPPWSRSPPPPASPARNTACPPRSPASRPMFPPSPRRSSPCAARPCSAPPNASFPRRAPSRAVRRRRAAHRAWLHPAHRPRARRLGPAPAHRPPHRAHVMPDDGPPRPLKPGETARLADAPLRADGSTLPPEALHAAPRPARASSSTTARRAGHAAPRRLGARAVPHRRSRGRGARFRGPRHR